MGMQPFCCIPIVHSLIIIVVLAIFVAVIAVVLIIVSVVIIFIAVVFVAVILIITIIAIIHYVLPPFQLVFIISLIGKYIHCYHQDGVNLYFNNKWKSVHYGRQEL